MKVSVIRASELSKDLCEAWRQLQKSNPDLANPFFSVDYTRAVAAVRDNVQIAIVETDGYLSAIFPFERVSKSVAGPVGGNLSDYQGLICAPDFECDPRELIKSCGLVAWDFTHLLASQRSFARFHQRHFISPIVDLSKGYAAYAEGNHALQAEQIKLRRIERDIGPLRFVSYSTDRALLDQVLTWKSRQYTAFGKEDLLATPWFRKILERIHQTRSDDFAGILSLLYAGDQLVAGHLGMSSRSVWHYWFPAYDRQFAKYSPGLLLLFKMAGYAPTVGIQVIDLGLGMSLYKERLSNGAISVASGSVECASLLSFRRWARRRLRSLVLDTWLERPVRALHEYVQSRREGRA